MKVESRGKLEIYQGVYGPVYYDTFWRCLRPLLIASDTRRL